MKLRVDGHTDISSVFTDIWGGFDQQAPSNFKSLLQKRPIKETIFEGRRYIHMPPIDEAQSRWAHGYFRIYGYIRMLKLTPTLRNISVLREGPYPYAVNEAQ